MERFVKRHEGRIKGIISGFDRILFRGTIPSINYREGLERWLWSQGVPLKDFAPFVEKVSKRLKENAESIARKAGRPFEYLYSPQASKEKIARKIMEKDHIKEGLVCVLTCVEPCRTVKIEKDREEKKLKAMFRDRQCLHIYFYFVDREFGLMHVRLQTWLPLMIQVWINGWEFLARRLDREGIEYEKRDNCLAHIGDFSRAQQIMDSLLERKWTGWLDLLAKRINPWLDPKNGLSLARYYWCIGQGEYSTDVVFNNADKLQDIYPALLNHAINHFSAKDILRFLQRRITVLYNGEIKSELKHRVEGARIKHWIDDNSIKMYDKQGVVLRIETTINQPRPWKVWRRATRKGKRVMAWIPMRKGVADIQRRVEVSRAANERYLEALSVVGETLPAHKILDPVSKPVTRNGRSYRSLRPVDPKDVAVFQVISRGEFLLRDFRNRDLRTCLYPEVPMKSSSDRSNSGRVSRTLRLLRVHGLIAKVPKTHAYRLTRKGNTVISAAIKLRQTNVLESAA